MFLQNRLPVRVLEEHDKHPFFPMGANDEENLGAI